MPQIKSKRLKSQISQKESIHNTHTHTHTDIYIYWIKSVLDKISQRFFFVHELKENYLSHKRTLWMEEPKPSFKWTKQSGKTQNDKSPIASKECKRAWEWGTNEYVFPCSVTIWWGLSYKKFECRSKWTSYIGLRRVIETLKTWFPYPSGL